MEGNVQVVKCDLGVAIALSELLSIATYSTNRVLIGGEIVITRGEVIMMGEEKINMREEKREEVHSSHLK